LAGWFAELEARAWETEIERDFAPGGAGMPFLEEMKAHARVVSSGRLSSLTE
jgi:hypothetical protein